MMNVQTLITIRRSSVVVKELCGAIDKDASFVACVETGPKSVKASRKAVHLFKENFQAVFFMYRLGTLEVAMACPAISKVRGVV